MTEPDDVSVCLDLMDERWNGYASAKKIIRDEIVRLRAIEKLLFSLKKFPNTTTDDANWAEFYRYRDAAAPVKGE